MRGPPIGAANGAGAELLGRLRGDADRRPRVDPGLAGGLREWLEDGAAEALDGVAAGGAPVVVDQRALTGGAPRSQGEEVAVPLARAVLVGALFRQLVTTGHISDPVGDALSAVGVDPLDARVAVFVTRLPPEERADLLRRVVEHAEVLVATWPVVSPAWLPRTAERRTLPVSGGRIVLSGMIDLMLGAPARARASVCLVDVRTGERRAEHRDDRHFLGLLETVAAGAPPFRVATYYTATGELDVEDVDDDLLFAAAGHAVEAMRWAVEAQALPWPVAAA